MQALRFQEYGGPSVLSVDTVPTPEPGPGEVRVAVEAAALNPVDRGVMAGAVGDQTPPGTPGVDAAGVVDAVGDRSPFSTGDRVVGTGLGRSGPGAMAEYVVGPSDQFCTIPPGVGFDEAAAVALVGATAWRGLVDAVDIQPADRVLVHGGNGGVGHVAVQLAASMGAQVTTTARPRHHDRLLTMGADTVLDYRDENLESAIEATGRPDVVVDHRLDEYFALDVSVLATAGTILGIGGDGGDLTALAVARDREPTLHHVSVFRTPSFRPVLGRLTALVEDGDVVPEIHRAYELGAAPEAYRDLEGRSTFGKLILTPP